MFQTGYYTIGHFKGAPIRLHWSLPLGALFFGGFRFAPGFWLGFILLILIHELGHAVMVRAVHQRVMGIDITGLHGACHWSGSPSQLQRALVAWGGVLAQLLLFVFAGTLLLFYTPQQQFLAELIHTFTRVNLMLIALNLIPIRPLDGAEAWPLFKILLRRRREKAALRKQTQWRPPHPADDSTPYDAKPAEPKYSDRVQDKSESEELFKRLMNNAPVTEEEDDR